MGLESESGEVTIPVEESTGEIKIANDVVATIAALAATETKGVAYLSGSLTHDVIAKHSSKNLFQGCYGHSRRKKCVCTDFTYYRVWMQRTGCNSKGTGAR